MIEWKVAPASITSIPVTLVNPCPWHSMHIRAVRLAQTQVPPPEQWATGKCKYHWPPCLCVLPLPAHHRSGWYACCPWVPIARGLRRDLLWTSSVVGISATELNLWAKEAVISMRGDYENRPCEKLCIRSFPDASFTNYSRIHRTEIYSMSMQIFGDQVRILSGSFGFRRRETQG